MLSGRTPFASTGDDTPEAILARIESGKVSNILVFVGIVIFFGCTHYFHFCAGAREVQIS